MGQQQPTKTPPAAAPEPKAVPTEFETGVLVDQKERYCMKTGSHVLDAKVQRVRFLEALPDDDALLMADDVTLVRDRMAEVGTRGYELTNSEPLTLGHDERGRYRAMAEKLKTR